MSATATATMPPPRAESPDDYRALADAYFRNADELTDEDLANCRRLMVECYDRLDRTGIPFNQLSPAKQAADEAFRAARKQLRRAIIQALRCRIDRIARSGDLILTLDSFGDLFPADLAPRPRCDHNRAWLKNTLETIRPGALRR